MEWVETTQKSVNLLGRYTAIKFALGKYISSTFLHDFKITHYKYINSDNQVQAFFSREELEGLYEILWKAIENGKMEEYLIHYEKCGHEFVSFCKALQHTNLKKLSNSEINELFRQWIQEYMKFIGYIYNGNFFIDIFTRKMLSKLSLEEETDEFRIMITPIEETDIGLRQKRIRKFLKKVKFPISLSKLPLELKKELIDIHETYCYLGSIFLTTNNYPYLDDFIEEINTITNIKNKEENLQGCKNEIMEKMNLSNDTKILLGRLAKLGYYRTEMLSFVQKGEYYSVGLFNKIAERLNINYKQLVNLTDEEIHQSLLKGRLVIDKEKIEQRFENYQIELNGNKIILSTPEKKEGIKRTVLEVKGVCASVGKAIGKVRILRNSSESSKMEKGEILVTFMTTPDYVSSMQKAAAIVTNDGGITCHAAIVSRELKIPCVIGTKIATKVLKDGMLVEVDANKGIVKILKKIA